MTVMIKFGNTDDYKNQGKNGTAILLSSWHHCQVKKATEKIIYAKSKVFSIAFFTR